MCLVYNTIGALSQVESYLIKNGLYEFNSISEILDFEKNYHFYEEQILFKHKSLIQNERKGLEEDIARLIEEISKNKNEQKEKLEQKLYDLNQKVGDLFSLNSKFITILKDLGSNIILWTKIWSAPILTRINLFISTRKQIKFLSQIKTRYEFINKNFDSAVSHSSSNELRTIARKRNLLHAKSAK